MKTMIVATDFSEASLNAAKYAAMLTRQIPVNRLLLYHSYYDVITVAPPFMDSEYYSRLEEDYIGRLNEVRDRLMPLVAAGITIECFANISLLQEAITVDFLKEKPDLIIMGITGKSQVKEKIIGSQAVIAARHTTIPLLLIPFNATFKGIKRIVFAWDMKDSKKTISKKILKDILQAFKAELLILNIDKNNKSFSNETIEEMEFMHHLFDPENAQYFYGDHPDASRGIISFSENHQADMVMIIPKKKSFPDSLFGKSMTKRLAFHIKVPLFILPSCK